ncbi:MAG: lamin tail domain-containing protein [bacterium]|nr:lamin tail domain-containing protein [bacterium]
MSRYFWQNEERMRRNLIIFFIAFLLLMLAANAARADDSANSLRLNEVYPSPASGEAEWLEIYNLATTPVSLRGWRILDASGNQELLLKEDREATLAAHGFFVLETEVVTLNNSGDTLYLLSPTGVQVDKVTTPSLRQTRSYARGVDGNGAWATTSKITKGLANNSSAGELAGTGTIIESATTVVEDEDEETYVPDLLGLELYPCPNSGEKEWLRLQNVGTRATNLSGFKLKNHNGYARNLSDITIEAGSSLKVEFTSGLAVNSGGNLFLLDPAGETLLEITYSACSGKGATFVYTNGVWTEKVVTVSETTENKANNSEQEEDATELLNSAAGAAEEKAVNATTAPALGRRAGQKLAAPKITYQKNNVAGAVLGASTTATATAGAEIMALNQGAPSLLFSILAIAVIMVGALSVAALAWQWWQESHSSTENHEKEATKDLVDY